MNWKSLLFGGLAGLVTGLMVGVVAVSVVWGISSWRAVQSLGLEFGSPQASAAMSVGLLCGAPPGAVFGLVGGLLGGLIARKANTGRAAIIWGVLLGLGFGLAGGMCGYLASGFLAR